MATTKKNELAKVDNAVIEALDSAIERGIAAQGMAGKMSRALAVAGAMQDLRMALDTPGVMDNVMALMNSALGFRTDKDPKNLDKNGKPNIPYDIYAVKDALIEGMMQGCYPVGNEFNIIASRCYITKEGMGRKLASIEGLGYSITPGVPKLIGQGAIQPMEVNWTYNGAKNNKTIEVCVRVNQGMGADAIVGKATRKARAWLFQHITGNEVPEGEIDEPINITPPKQSPFEKSPKPHITEDAPADLKADPLAEWARVIDASPLTLQDWERFANHRRGEAMTPENAALWLEDTPRYINACLDFLDEQKPAAGTDGELL